MNGISTHCITFGAPLFANESVRLFCESEMFDHQMIHFVGHKDIVPGILSLGHSINEIKKRATSVLNEATGSLISTEICLKYSSNRWTFRSFFQTNQNL